MEANLVNGKSKSTNRRKQLHALVAIEILKNELKEGFRNGKITQKFASIAWLLDDQLEQYRQDWIS